MKTEKTRKPGKAVWVQFWADVNCSSGHSSKTVTATEFYSNVSDDDDESLKEIAQEAVPSWMQHSERGFRFGYEILDPLPEDVRLSLVTRFKRELQNAERHLRILGALPPLEPQPPGPVDRFERISKDGG